jgi:hypothetical protein
VAHAFNPSTWEAEADGFLSSRPAWSTEWVPGQPGLHRETLSRKNKRKKKRCNKNKFFHFLVLVLVLVLVFRDRVSLCSPGCPETHSVDQAGLELRNPSASASQVLGLKSWGHHCPARISILCDSGMYSQHLGGGGETVLLQSLKPAQST